MAQSKLGTFITRYCEENKILINDLAINMGVPHTTVSRWVSGKNTPSLHYANRLAMATNTNLCYIVELIYPQPPRRLDPSILRLAEQLGDLPKEAIELMDAMMFGLSLKYRKTDPDKN